LAEDVGKVLRRIEAPHATDLGPEGSFGSSRGRRPAAEVDPQLPAARSRGAARVPMFDRPEEFDVALLAFFAGAPVGD
jgi:hypothetical protein